MKRMGKILLSRAAGAIAAELSRMLGRRTSSSRIDTPVKRMSGLAKASGTWLPHHGLEHFGQYAGDGAGTARMADQHQGLGLMQQLADWHVDQPPGAAFELDIERGEKGDAVFQDR